MLNEYEDDSKLNGTQRMVRDISIDSINLKTIGKSDMYDLSEYIYLTDKALDGAMVKMKDGIRPSFDMEDSLIDGLYYVHFLNAIPFAFNRLGFGSKCYMSLLDKYKILLSGNNDIHSVSDSAEKMLRNRQNSIKVV